MLDPNDTEARLRAAAFCEGFYKISAERGEHVPEEQRKVLDGFIYWLRNDRLPPNAVKS